MKARDSLFGEKSEKVEYISTFTSDMKIIAAFLHSCIQMLFQQISMLKSKLYGYCTIKVVKISQDFLRKYFDLSDASLFSQTAYYQNEEAGISLDHILNVEDIYVFVKNKTIHHRLK